MDFDSIKVISLRHPRPPGTTYTIDGGRDLSEDTMGTGRNQIGRKGARQVLP